MLAGIARVGALGGGLVQVLAKGRVARAHAAVANDMALGLVLLLGMLLLLLLLLRGVVLAVGRRLGDVRRLRRQVAPRACRAPRLLVRRRHSCFCFRRLRLKDSLTRTLGRWRRGGEWRQREAEAGGQALMELVCGGLRARRHGPGAGAASDGGAAGHTRQLVRGRGAAEAWHASGGGGSLAAGRAGGQRSQSES